MGRRFQGVLIALCLEGAFDRLQGAMEPVQGRFQRTLDS